LVFALDFLPFDLLFYQLPVHCCAPYRLRFECEQNEEGGEEEEEEEEEENVSATWAKACDDYCSAAMGILWRLVGLRFWRKLNGMDGLLILVFFWRGDLSGDAACMRCFERSGWIFVLIFCY
jgi:hypothetical protein